MPRDGRPPIEISVEKLKAFMRIKPSLEDTAAWFECDPSTIARFIKDNFDKTFREFRDENMVHTRHDLVRVAMGKALKGDNVMLIFCLKNLCGWKDRYEEEPKDKPDAPQKTAEMVKEFKQAVISHIGERKSS